MLKLKLQYFGHLMWRADSLEKTLVPKDWRQEKKQMKENEMVGWHRRLNALEFEQTPGDSEGKGSLVCCSLWGHKESDTTEWLNLLTGSPMDCLSELSTMTHLYWVALHGMAHSFIELDKAVVHLIRLVSLLWLWFCGWDWVLFWWPGPCSVNL